MVLRSFRHLWASGIGDYITSRGASLDKVQNASQGC
jgi:hypothetical protein